MDNALKDLLLCIVVSIFLDLIRMKLNKIIRILFQNKLVYKVRVNKSSQN